jgi:MarR family transcriptional regulator, lower aerobic nicotinate degradation pathway regulator
MNSQPLSRSLKRAKSFARKPLSHRTSLLPVSELEDHLGFWLRTLSKHVHTSFERSLQRHGVTVAQWMVLRTLYRKDISLNELARSIGIDQGSTSRLIDRLVIKRLIARETRPEDRRGVRLSLTTSARKLVPKLARVADDNDEFFLGRISRKDRGTLFRILKELIEKNALS